MELQTLRATKKHTRPIKVGLPPFISLLMDGAQESRRDDSLEKMAAFLNK